MAGSTGSRILILTPFTFCVTLDICDMSLNSSKFQILYPKNCGEDDDDDDDDIMYSLYEVVVMIKGVDD